MDKDFKIVLDSSVQGYKRKKGIGVKLFNYIIVIIFLIVIGTTNSYGIEGDITISDKEIIERLSHLEEGQANIEKRIDNLTDSINKRFDDVNNRIDDVNNSINKRIDDLDNSANKRIYDLDNSINKRFDDLNDSINKRIGDVISLIHILITVLSLVGAGVFATLLLMWRTLSVHKGKFEAIDKQLEQVSFFKEMFLKLQDNVNDLIKRFKPPDKIL